MSAAAPNLCDAGLADLDAVMAVMDDSFDPRFGEAWTAGQCAGLLPMPGVWLTLARDRADGGAIGFALARAVAGEAELLLLAVRSTVQRRGIGAMLLDRFEAEAAGRGARRFHLEVREGNHALSLYERAGYALVGRRRNYYSGHGGTTFDALTLAKIAGNLR
jgi:ribosomal-protein-alanine N-acetyltransferase